MQTAGKKVITQVLGLTYAPCMDTIMKIVIGLADTALNRQINRVEELNLRGGGEIFNDSDSDDINESSGNDIDDIYAVTVMTAVDCDDISCGDGGDVRQRYG